MKNVGCDLNTRYRQIAMLDTGTGELIELMDNAAAIRKDLKSCAKAVHSVLGRQ